MSWNTIRLAFPALALIALLLLAGCVTPEPAPPQRTAITIERGASMQPWFGVGATCYTSSQLSWYDIQPGHIIAFRTGRDLLTVHRVTQVATDYVAVRTQGDNNATSETVFPSQFVGIVYRIVGPDSRELYALHATNWPTP